MSLISWGQAVQEVWPLLREFAPSALVGGVAGAVAGALLSHWLSTRRARRDRAKRAVAEFIEQWYNLQHRYWWWEFEHATAAMVFPPAPPFHVTRDLDWALMRAWLRLRVATGRKIARHAKSAMNQTLRAIKDDRVPDDKAIGPLLDYLGIPPEWRERVTPSTRG